MNRKLAKHIEDFKQEIIRLGLEDNASKTKFNELYNSDNSLSPTYLMNASGMTWHELITSCGFKAKTVQFENRSDEEIYQSAAEFVKINKVISGTDYTRKQKDSPEYPTYYVLCHRIGWKKFAIRFVLEQKGVAYFQLPWKELTNQQIIQLIIFEDERRRFESSTEMIKRKSSAIPNQHIASQRFGGYKVLYSIIIGRRKE